MYGGDVTGSAPSFEEMGVAIKQIIVEESRCDDDDDDGDGDNTTLSPEHQQLMTWAWLNIKVRHATADTSSS